MQPCMLGGQQTGRHMFLAFNPGCCDRCLAQISHTNLLIAGLQRPQHGQADWSLCIFARAHITAGARASSGWCISGFGILASQWVDRPCIHPQPGLSCGSTCSGGLPLAGDLRPSLMKEVLPCRSRLQSNVPATFNHSMRADTL